MKSPDVADGYLRTLAAGTLAQERTEGSDEQPPDVRAQFFLATPGISSETEGLKETSPNWKETVARARS